MVWGGWGWGWGSGYRTHKRWKRNVRRVMDMAERGKEEMEGTDLLAKGGRR